MSVTDRSIDFIDDSDGPDEDEFYDYDFEEEELEDRLGRIDQKVIGDELVLTRIPSNEERDSYEVLRFDRQQQLIRIFPKSTEYGALVPQFDRISELQIESPGWNSWNHSAEHGQYALLYVRGLPKGFSSIYEFGLGINRDYRHVIDGIEEHTECAVVRFVVEGPEGVDPNGTTFRISLQRFADYRAAIDRSRARGRTAVRRVIDADTHNAIAGLFGMKPMEPKYTKNPVIRALTEEVATGHVTDAGERALIADELTVAAPAIAREAPERLVQLREDIELVSLEALIEQFEKDLEGPHSRDEGHWQTFFSNNRFALQLIFSAPIVVAREHATVQAPDIDGRGARITDFLCANSVTRTVAIVEIKTPATPLVSTSPYRGKGTDAAVYPPHQGLSGSIAQLQSQLASVPQSLASRLTPELALDPWNDPRGAVITGRVSALNKEQLESFLRYRAGLSTVVVLGYDEVLERLKALHAMLASPPRLDAEANRAEGQPYPERD
ncbi:Shedu anti-phage system protein SduA domain-containing protein [Agromyces bauzanensis]